MEGKGGKRKSMLLDVEWKGKKSWWVVKEREGREVTEVKKLVGGW